jgi:uncharacterized membrane protein
MFILVNIRYYALNSNIADLGFFLTNLFNISHLCRFDLAFSGHFQPLLIPLAYLYKLFPIDFAPYFLLNFQFLIILLSIFFTFKLYGKYVSLALVLFPPLWSIVLNDFHIDVICFPILLLFFYFFKSNKYYLATTISLTLFLVKEPYSLLIIFCGLYFIVDYLINFRQRLIVFILGIIQVILGFLLFKFSLYIIELFTFNYSSITLNSSAFSYMGGNVFDIIIYILFNLFQLIFNIFNDSGKVFYLLIIFGSFLFIPLLSPMSLIVAIPLLAISLLSNVSNYFSYNTHYSVGLLAPLIISFSSGLNKIQKFTCQSSFYKYIANIKIIIIFIFFIHICISISPLSRLFWSDKILAYNYKSYLPTDRNENIKSAILQFIPRDFKIVVSSQNSLNWGFLANRELLLPFPVAVDEPFLSPLKSPGVENSKILLKPVFADYVVLDLDRTIYLGDKGCDFIYNECQNQSIYNKFLDSLAYTRKNYHLLYQYDNFFIFKRL